MRVKLFFLIHLVGCFLWSETVLSDFYWNTFGFDRSILMIRHAHATNLKGADRSHLTDCSTRQHLSQEGQDQARQIGRWLKKRNLSSNQVEIYSSERCPSFDTAEWIAEALGVKVRRLSVLNPFDQSPKQSSKDRRYRQKSLERFLIDKRRNYSRTKKFKLLILVTHFGTIKTMTGMPIPSSAGVLLDYHRNEESLKSSLYDFLALIDFGQRLKIDWEED